MASLATQGDLLAVALADGSLRIMQEGREIGAFAGDGRQHPVCPTAMTFLMHVGLAEADALPVGEGVLGRCVGHRGEANNSAG